jgi:hypothetical protein
VIPQPNDGDLSAEQTLPWRGPQKPAPEHISDINPPESTAGPSGSESELQPPDPRAEANPLTLPPARSANTPPLGSP